MGNIDRLIVLYGSQTFTAQEVAERIWRTTKILGFKGPVQAMDDYPISRLIHEEFALFVCSNTGQGDEPDNMKRFWKFLLRKNLPTNSLVKLKFGVVGLGDSSYSKFNFVGKKLYKRLIQLGAKPLLNIALCDYQHDLGHDAVLIPWSEEFFTKMRDYFPDMPTDINTSFIPRWKVAIQKNEDYQNGHSLNKDIYYAKGYRDNFLEVHYFEVEQNVRTTHVTHFQDVRLMTFKTVKDDKLDYNPGDIFNIRPRNSEEDVNDLFDIFYTHNMDIKPHYRLLVEENYDGMPVPDFLKEPLTLYEIAEQYWDLRAYPTQYVFALLALVSEDRLERDKCIELSSPEGQEDWLNYCRRPKRTILEVLHDFHKSTSKLTIDILFELFSAIKPRSFSIASSCLPSQGRKLDVLVAMVKYYTKLKQPRLGLASNWLKCLNVGDQVYGWIKKGSLKFPTDLKTPHIMIGPGTGLAPFRSVLQDRVYKGTAHKDVLHLFFGCRYSDKDFHCREELLKMVQEEKLTLYCAFSRDQEDKIYVQHKIKEHSDELWHLINDKGAYTYISGNAKNMPDSVRSALVEVFHTRGAVDSERAKDMLACIEREGRLQLETW
ncbi:NADPH-dependent diflavin oxidoreductase 1 [Maniola hyperantus]|uniref:NADPH-dependent diflavin oxidoreductase 1 n=1 Tax=Aphantopus hyperantus TaxID=2795564 RepID=UPI0015685873|nr:NADPH-dependent diflavin oxidoreductase 1 [Maniola hyperantus]